MRKYDVIREIALKSGCRRFLEISTPTTGLTFIESVESDQFDLCERLVYRCPANYFDGLPITFRTKDECISELLANLAAVSDEPRYDMIFVDSWHTLDSSALDLFGAWSLLRPGGVMVVHDCNPHRYELTAATPPGSSAEWTGVTYQAFVEFLLCGLHEKAFTIDTDYGVGVVYKSNGGDASVSHAALQAKHCLKWHLLRGNPLGRYQYFTQNRQELIGLIKLSEFIHQFGLVLVEETPDEVYLDEFMELMVQPSDEWFDETSYRKLHVDVASAIRRGVISSGHEHFISRGAHEGRMFRRLDKKGSFVLSQTDRPNGTLTALNAAAG